MAFSAVTVCLAFLVAIVSAGRVYTEEDNSGKTEKSSHKLADIDLADTVARLTEDLQHLQAKVSTIEQLEARVEELEKQVQQKCGDSDEVINGPDDMTEDEKDTSEGPENNPGQRSAIRDGAMGLRRGIRQSAEFVAFSTVVTKDVQHLGEHQTIKYDKIILNTGGGYSANSGVFTTPTAGTYLFLYHMGHHGTGETWVEIMKNGASLNGFAVEGTGSSQNLQGSNSVVLDLDVGDEVWVETFQVNDVTLHGFFTTFSGVLLV